jgi:hypothetical protein
MSVLQRPHYVLKPSELADWLDREPDTWWIIDGDRRLTGERIDLPCPGEELAELLRRYKKDLFFYPIEPVLAGSQPAGETIDGQRFGELADRDNPQQRRTFLLSWSDRDEEWLLEEYPSWKLDDDER